MRAAALAVLAAALLAGCDDAETYAARERAFQFAQRPEPIATADGVTLYRVRDRREARNVYFTAPCGGVVWTVTEGKTTRTITTAGPECPRPPVDPTTPSK